uniref:PX domain-containing protein n=1 Tax=Timema tahoe TaxID=61484 RepID=A0A7R9IEF6_9NEOP|nr:unnamed protein product [Timema tahoe]
MYHLFNMFPAIDINYLPQTSRAEFDDMEYVARRRYNDFVWLRQKLVEAFPTHLIPVSITTILLVVAHCHSILAELLFQPLPGKHTLLAQLDRYSKEFILARMALLHRFLNRVANHPVLSCNNSLKVFLTAKPSEFSIHRKSRQGLLGRMSSSFNNLAAVYMIRQRTPEFEHVREYVTMLGEKLSSIDKISQRIHKERQDYLYELHQLHPIFTLWSASEPELNPVLLALASAGERSAQAQHQVLVTYTPIIVQPLKEYLLYVEAVKETLIRRDSVQIEYELTQEELNKRRLEKDQLGILHPRYLPLPALPSIPGPSGGPAKTPPGEASYRRYYAQLSMTSSPSLCPSCKSSLIFLAPQSHGCLVFILFMYVSFLCLDIVSAIVSRKLRPAGSLKTSLTDLPRISYWGIHIMSQVVSQPRTKCSGSSRVRIFTSDVVLHQRSLSDAWEKLVMFPYLCYSSFPSVPATPPLRQDQSPHLFEHLISLSNTWPLCLMSNEQQQQLGPAGVGGFSIGGTSLWRSPGEVRDGKLQKLEQTIPQLVKQVEENQDKVECANENLRADLERWNKEKKNDLKTIFLALANQQIKYYEQCLAAWEDILPEAKPACDTPSHYSTLESS